jgi:4-coumarate--CoA ligase
LVTSIKSKIVLLLVCTRIHYIPYQAYGLTESSGSASATMGPEESKMYGSAGRLSANLQAKIVDPATGEALGPCQRGELWLRGPVIMNGMCNC